MFYIFLFPPIHSWSCTSARPGNHFPNYTLIQFCIILTPFSASQTNLACLTALASPSRTFLPTVAFEGSILRTVSKNMRPSSFWMNRTNKKKGNTQILFNFNISVHLNETYRSPSINKIWPISHPGTLNLIFFNFDFLITYGALIIQFLILSGQKANAKLENKCFQISQQGIDSENL